jgi:alkylation response protein AidB-like acyl-CoA dehydrogenase
MDYAFFSEEAHAFADMARAFTKKTVLPIFEADFSDGDLGQLPEILKKAFEVGLAASPDPDMPGFDHGIWGDLVNKSGFGISMMLLSIIAETCGGIAANLHFQGAAANVLLNAPKKPLTLPRVVALAVQEEFGFPGYGTLFSPGEDSPARIATTATAINEGYLLNGFKSFIYSMKEPEAFVIFARIEKKDQWGCFLIPSDISGLEIIPVGHRTGLRAVDLNHLKIRNISVSEAARIDAGGDALNLLIRALCLNWLGCSAIAAGIARGAVEAAGKYASERYQGGKIIADHPAIRGLLAEAETKTYGAGCLVAQAGVLDLDKSETLARCAMTKMLILELCAKAVTDSLQCFGGYGYMEDYGMEKRLRDITVLKSAAGSPPYLRGFIFHARRGVK